MINRVAVVLALTLFTANALADAPTTAPTWLEPITPVERTLPEYERLPNLTGTIRSVGSPTTNALIFAWAEEFKKIYPAVEFDVKGGNSAIVAPAMIGKTPPNIGSMSRAFSDDEVADFKRKFGYEPTGIRVAINAVAIFVNSDNPVNGLTLPQLDAIFSRTGKAGLQPILAWGEAGVRDPSWATEKILPYNLDPTRGEFRTMKSRVLLDGEFRYDAASELTSSAIVQDVAVDRGAIGYASMVYRTRRARPVPLAAPDGAFYAPTYENCLEQKYPLADFLYIYVNKSPNHPLDPATREFLAFACSHLGQELAAREGAYPLTAKLAREQLELIGK
jgi:phosphate transport system substrate-binding protein